MMCKILWTTLLHVSERKQQRRLHIYRDRNFYYCYYHIGYKFGNTFSLCNLITNSAPVVSVIILYRYLLVYGIFETIMQNMQTKLSSVLERRFALVWTSCREPCIVLTKQYKYPRTLS